MTRCLHAMALVGMLLLALRLIGVIATPWWLCAAPLTVALLSAVVLVSLAIYDQPHRLED